MTKRMRLTLAAVAVLGIGGQAALAGDGHHRGYGRPGGDRFYATWTPRPSANAPRGTRDQAYSRSSSYYYSRPVRRGWSYSSSSHSRILGVPNAGGHQLWLRY